MLLHALLGCCLHHGHSCAGDAAVRVAVAGADGSACSHGHCHEHRDKLAGAVIGGDSNSHNALNKSHAPAPVGPHQCESGDCAFMSSGAPAFVVDLGVTWISTERLVESDEAISIARASCSAFGDLPPPLSERLQSQNCIWLI